MWADEIKCCSDVIEVTGSPGSGKTTLIGRNFSDISILLGGMPLFYGPAKRLFYSFVLALYALATGAISVGQTKWLIKKVMVYDETLFSKMNAFRNSMTKFGYHFFKSKDNALLIDEGISHIPFILGLRTDDINEFITIFRQHLKKVNIIFIEAPSMEVLKTRILTRGHKRVRSGKNAEGFVKINIKIAENYKKALLNSGLDVTFV